MGKALQTVARVLESIFRSAGTRVDQAQIFYVSGDMGAVLVDVCEEALNHKSAVPAAGSVNLRSRPTWRRHVRRII